VPANFGELTVFAGDETRGELPWRPRYTVTLRAADAPSQVLFEGNVEGSATPYVKLGVQLKAGKSYLVEAAPICDPAVAGDVATIPRAQITLEVGAASEPPTTLGPLRQIYWEGSKVPIARGTGCWEDANAATADVMLDGAALPEAWRDLVSNYQLMVDDKPFDWLLTSGVLGPTTRARASYITNPGVFRAWTSCEDVAGFQFGPVETGLAPGKHTLWVRARVPSSTPTLIESQRLEVELRCPFAVDGPSTRPQVGGTIAPTTSEDAAPPPPVPENAAPDDAGVEEAGPVDANGNEGTPGCSASQLGLLTRRSWLFPGLLTGCFAALRRVRQRRRLHEPR
jgi:hypothetical protein